VNFRNFLKKSWRFPMIAATGTEAAMAYRRYEPRLKNLVAKSNDLSQFLALGIPVSTLRQWQKNGVLDFFTLPQFELSDAQLIQENLKLAARVDALVAEKTLITKTITIFGFQIQYQRLPSAEAKSEILAAIKGAASMFPLSTCLELIGLSTARYHAWIKRQIKCLLLDQVSCPRISPTKLTTAEVAKIKSLYTSSEFAHYSMIALSWLAKKTGEVMASASTWSRVVRQYGLSRTQVRIYPPRPKIGIRASAPGQIWHLDLTILRLQDGTKAFVQCVIDNFSRYVLAWKVSPDYGGLHTKELLLAAIKKAGELGLNLIPEVFVDSGTENLNEHVDQLVSSDTIKRTIAQIDVEFSNSMIEMLFHRLKHRYLFTIPLTNFTAVEKGVNFYLTESNICIPHSALKGATPEESITGKWNDEKITDLKVKLNQARTARVTANQSLQCTPCLA